MRRKLNVQLILLTLCIAIPVVVVIAFLGIHSNRLQLREQLSQNQAEAQERLSQMDLMLEMLGKTLAYMSVDDTQIRSIAAAREQDTQFWLENNQLSRKLQNQMLINGMDFTSFLYFPQQGIVYNAQVNPAVTDRLREMADQQAEPAPGTWSRMECEGISYLYLLMDYQDYYIGAWGSYAQLLQSIPQTDTERYLITDLQGNVLSDPSANALAPKESMVEFHGAQWYMAAADSSQSEFRLVKLISRKIIDGQMISIGMNILITTGAFVLLLLAYMFFLNIWILKPVQHLRRSMEIIRSGDLEHRITPLQSASEEFGSMIGEFNHLMDSIQELKISIYESELEQKEVRLAYLSRQIQPHFILNSLNTLYNHTEDDPAVIKEMIRLISSYYRYVVNVNSTFVLLGQELDHIDHYLNLQKLRYPGLFTYEIVCGENLSSMQIPPFIIESFVGNIFKHGFIPGTINVIRVSAQRAETEGELVADAAGANGADDENGSVPADSPDGLVRIRIEDNGMGFSDDSLDAIADYLEQNLVSEELGVGIRNSIERLQLIYKEQTRIRIYNKPDHGAVVEFEIPERIA